MSVPPNGPRHQFCELARGVKARPLALPQAKPLWFRVSVLLNATLTKQKKQN